MVDAEMWTAAAQRQGFIAALDQSGGSTPGALKLYGVPENAYNGEAEMFAEMHAMRVRIVSSPAFTGEKVMGAILFEKTMDSEGGGLPMPQFLWQQRKVVPFLKVDQGLQAEADGVSLMKPTPGLEALLERALKREIFGTKMRSVIHAASPTGVAAIVAQQFEVALRIARVGLVPIVEPEVSIKAVDKPQCEALLRDRLLAALEAMPEGMTAMLKLTIPEAPDFYDVLVNHPRVLRVVALSGGYPRDEACRRLKKQRGMIASFSRALVEDLRRDMSDAEFDATLGRAIDEIHDASVNKAA